METSKLAHLKEPADLLFAELAELRVLIEQDLDFHENFASNHQFKDTLDNLIPQVSPNSSL